MYNLKESWTDEDTSLTYLGNLTGLIREVRSEMFEASEPDTWQCASAIPVVVVQIGYWYVCMNYTSSYLHLLFTYYCESLTIAYFYFFRRPQRDRAQRVRDAQAKYCEEDPRAEMVISNDLGRYYHYDATSMLIIGNRIAQAYQKALDSDVTCPAPTISPVPTVSASPSSYPTTYTPTYSPTLVLAPIPSPPPFFCEHISTFFCFS